MLWYFHKQEPISFNCSLFRCLNRCTKKEEGMSHLKSQATQDHGKSHI
ncbi:hypothetical protein Hdeb2414_s0009g00319101 [Helianthus debilis subsp. tardiflorus]